MKKFKLPPVLNLIILNIFRKTLLCTGVIFLWTGIHNLQAQETGNLSSKFHFELQEIDSFQNRMGATALVDMDKDSDLDYVFGRFGDMYWYEYSSPSEWVLHEIGKGAKTDVGGIPLDVNQDDWMDFVVGDSWYENTGKPKTENFILHQKGMLGKAHDLIAVDVDGDKIKDIVSISNAPQDPGLVWYKMPEDHRAAWKPFVIGEGIHGGIGPHGYGDLDNNGTMDIVRGNWWFENADGKGTEWKAHQNLLPPGGSRDGPFGLALKTWVYDLNNDGMLDIVQAEGDTENGRVFWWENINQGESYIFHLISAENTYQDMHSLALADFDGDGSMDILSGGGPLSKEIHRLFIWENINGDGSSWKEHLILEGYRSHETVAGDVDGNGLIDIVSKPWRGGLHYFLENKGKGKLFSARDSPPGPMIFPEAAWKLADPENQGMDTEKLKEAITYLKDNSGSDGVKELMIVRNGHLVWKGTAIDKVHNIWSLTKSFTSTALGLLMEDGKATLDTRAMKHVPELAENYPDVTLRHFTTMTSGYSAVGDEPWAKNASHGQSSTPFMPSKPLYSPPGSKFAYWDSSMNQFAHVLTRIAGESIEHLFKKRIADPIDMDTQRWDWKDWGEIEGLIVNGGAGNKGKGINISASELARFGHLFLNQGKWKDQQLLSAEWVKEAVAAQVPAALPMGHSSSDAGPGLYGYNWWTNGVNPEGVRKWPDAPTGTFAASGFNNNDMFVIPEWNMVVVRLGLDQKEFLITDAVYNEFLQKVGQSIMVFKVKDDRKGEAGRI